MKTKIMNKCIEKLEEAKIGRHAEQNINYVLEYFHEEVRKNSFLGKVRNLRLKKWREETKKRK